MLGTRILEERKSKFNGDLRVVRTLGMGTYIQAGGLTQSGGIVQTIWKSTLKQINHLSNQPINTVLVLGLGGGTVAKLIRKNWPKAKITGIEIDPIMIELGEKYLRLGDCRVKIITADASNLSSLPNLSNSKFDLIIVDLYQGDQFPKKFEKESLLRLILRLLSKGGVAVFNRLYYGNKKSEAIRFGQKLEKIFSKVEPFHPTSNLMFICQ